MGVNAPGAGIFKTDASKSEARKELPIWNSERSADCQLATQQVANLGHSLAIRGIPGNFDEIRCVSPGVILLQFPRSWALLQSSDHTMHLAIPYKENEIVLVAESPYAHGHNVRSADDACTPEEEYFLGDKGYRPSSRHRIAVRHGDAVLASRVLLAGGGGSGVHKRSAFVRADTCFVAVGAFICALELPTLRLLWHTRADTATCFGVYDAPAYASIISHGELEIARLSYSGELLWSGSGRDIFSEGFELHEHHVEAIDFDGTRYSFELETGHSQIVLA